MVIINFVNFSGIHGYLKHKPIRRHGTDHIYIGIDHMVDSGASVGFNDTCDGSNCDTNEIANLIVLNLQATAVSPTQIKVDWSLPTHVSAINRFEVLWTGNAVPVTLSSSTTTYTINNLTSETSYNVVVTSVDTTSRPTEQKVHADQVTAITSSVLGFDAECRVSADCDTSKSLECVELTTKTCKCNTDLYYYGETCKNNQIIELKVTNVQVSPTGTDSLYVTWTNPTANSVIERKEVIWTGPSQGSKTVAVGDTSTAITGLTPGGSYTITVVSIDTNSRNEQQEVTSDAVNKKTKSALGGSCSLVSDCDGSNVECVTISELKVTNVQVSPTGTDSLYVTWTNPTANSAIESKQVRWTGTSSGSKNMVVSSMSTSITGLTLGGTYTITVVSIDTDSRIQSQEVSSDTVQQKTKSALGGSCTSVTYCDGSNVECVSTKCQCKTTFYDDNNAEKGGTCKSSRYYKEGNII
ncbi:hypothetical protein KUTeg_000868 [Tegillarca granosa]|uniref:Fibronectin type-III domain-containing protein n=1 Tax=Tegillarca granosa TaxID=220873 RepID=A0ABQ9FWE9_TEGGR|nr:hypothetical protein KUTeg_000868 [Tegillarca granosa]